MPMQVPGVAQPCGLEEEFLPRREPSQATKDRQAFRGPDPVLSDTMTSRFRVVEVISSRPLQAARVIEAEKGLALRAWIKAPSSHVIWLGICLIFALSRTLQGAHLLFRFKIVGRTQPRKVCFHRCSY